MNNWTKNYKEYLNNREYIDFEKKTEKELKEIDKLENIFFWIIFVLFSSVLGLILGVILVNVF